MTPELTECVNDSVCPKCQTTFQPKRTNQTYCSRKCQKNASRGSRANDCSRSQRRQNQDEWALLHLLNETYYGTKPGARLGLLKDWLDRAREGDTALRRVLSNPAFFAPDRDDESVCFRRCLAYPSVPKEADRFCRLLRGCRVWEWVNGSAPEPETGEVLICNPPPAYVVGYVRRKEGMPWEW